MTNAVQTYPLSTTLALLRASGACPHGYRKLLEHLGDFQKYGAQTPIPLTVVLDSNGIDDALWCLTAVPPEQEQQRNRLSRLLACDYAERGLPLFEAAYPADTRPRHCIEISRRFALGMATDEELAAARSAAWSAWDAAWSSRFAELDGSPISAAWCAWSTAWSTRSDGSLRSVAWSAWTSARSVRDAATCAWSATDNETETQWQVDRFRDYLNGNI